MLRSEERILTTHTGSLPRPDDLIKMMFAKEEGVPVPDNTNLSFRAFIMGTSELFKAKDQPPVTTVHNGQEKSIMDFGQFKPDRDFLAVYVGSTGDASLPGSMD